MAPYCQQLGCRDVSCLIFSVWEERVGRRHDLVPNTLRCDHTKLEMAKQKTGVKQNLSLPLLFPQYPGKKGGGRFKRGQFSSGWIGRLCISVAACKDDS